MGRESTPDPPGTVTPSPGAPAPASYHWLADGAEFFCRVLRAIHVAQKSLRVEVYIFANDPVGCRVRDALVAAAVRGVTVRVLLDSLGSAETANGFWDGFQRAAVNCDGSIR